MASVMNVRQNLVIAVLMTIVSTIGLGVLYPFAVTWMAQGLFPDKANGQLIYRDGRLVGSRILGQSFSSPGYFRSRPSAVGYDAGASGGSNLGPTNRQLVAAVQANAAAARRENPAMPVPIDLVTASGSGLDPHTSPDAAAFQLPRVARERRMTEAELRRIVAEFTEGPTFGLLGEARVNVLLLNLALDARYPIRQR